MKRKAKKKAAPIQSPLNASMAVENYRLLLTPAEYELLVKEIDQPLLPAIRFNPLKTSKNFEDLLHSKYSWTLEPLPYCSSGYRVITGAGPEVSSVLEHKLGMFYIQEAASMLPVELFTISDNEESICLDLAASPGGKTTHLISRLYDRGLVIANDSSQGRIPALRIVLQQWGAVACAVTRFTGESYGTWFPEIFDRVLLDAPCSMQGLRIADSHVLRPVTTKESTQLSVRQSALLTSALQAVKVGGEVVYSTCTLLPAEDEGVINSVLKRFGSSIKLLDAQSVLPAPAPGILQSNEIEYSPEMEKTIRLWPHRYHTAGFFASILQKTAPLNLPITTPPTHDMEAAGFVELTGSQEAAVSNRFAAAYGYDLQSYLSSERRVLVQRDQKVYLFPSLLLERFRDLPVQSAGLLLGEDTPEGFLPSQEWISRFGTACQCGTLTLDRQEARRWLNGENLEMDLPVDHGQRKYVIILDQDGHALGCGKVTGRGIKNLLPRRMI